MARRKVICLEIPIEFGDHVVYLISATSEKQADAYILKKFGVDIRHSSSEEESGAYFVGEYNQLFLYYPPGLGLEYLVHEIEHMYRYMINRMGTNPDEEGAAYIRQMLFKKILSKLEEVGFVQVYYLNE